MSYILRGRVMRMEAKQAAAAERRRDRRFRAALVPLALGVGAAVGAVVVLEGEPDARAWGLALLVLGIAAVAVAGALAWRWRPDATAQAAAAGQGRRDREQKARREGLWMTPVILGLGLLVVTPAVWRALDGSGSFADWLWAGCGLVYAWLAPAMVMGWDGGSRRKRKFLEDELTRALRARAMTAGFLVLLAAMSAVYVLGLWRPEAAIAAMPAALASGGLAAALRFAALDRAADEGGDE